MKNVTLTLDDEVARWARIRAAELDTSVSRLLSDLLREMMAREMSYQTAMERYLGRKPRVLHEPGAPYPVRDALHDRTDLR
jgi:plasmid stability protein